MQVGYGPISSRLDTSGITKNQISRSQAYLCKPPFDQAENIKYIQSKLGHSSPTVPMNVYAHLMKQPKYFESRIFD